jgi:acylphosphatase
MKKHFSILIFGKVQGVFFRASARSHATLLDITGIAQNEKDGSVYIEAEGEEANLNEFIAWCHRGPERAEVTRVELKGGLVKNYKSFEVKRGKH